MTATQQRKAFIPASAEQQAEVKEELNAILSHPQFSQSKRYPALLRYLVEHTLQGDTAHIKERTLGIEVFGRDATYDTTSDTVVRFTASEVRRRLATFYNQHHEHAIHISLPVGSYIPEFLREDEAAAPVKLSPSLSDRELEPGITSGEPESVSPAAPLPTLVVQPQAPASVLPATTADGVVQRSPRQFLVLACVALVCLLAGGLATALLLRARTPKLTAVDRFWRPLTNGDVSPVLISGGNVFSNNPYSGTETAGREVEYPFVSMQIASAMARVSAVVRKEGHMIGVQAANTTTLSDLRDRPLVLVGGYNNVWTGELTNGLPIRLGPPAAPAFEEQSGAKRIWRRDGTQPYSAAEDYALVGRFRSAATDSMVVLVAGLGRNGTEAASQFLTDERRMQALEDLAGHKLDGQNFEAVLKVPVIQGRTGAPQVLAVRTW